MLKRKRMMSLTLALVVLAASVLPMRTPVYAAAEEARQLFLLRTLRMAPHRAGPRKATNSLQ